MKEHAKLCAFLKPLHYGDLRNQFPNEMGECDCDGYHTFKELYDHRITLFITLCKLLDRETWEGWRSKLHSDGTSFDGWFILGIGKSAGKQITYHLPMIRWDETEFAETLDRAPEFDGHTSEDVLKRLATL
jgi:hypothetical protein